MTKKISKNVRYWLMKTEPDAFSFNDLIDSPKSTAHWDGVRNYQARNLMRDDFKLGDRVLIYHSNAKPPGVVGVAEVVREAYPDHTALDPESKYFDAKSAEKGESRWCMVDVQAKESFREIVSLNQLRETEGLEEMMVTKRGQRLSIQPVTPREWKIVCAMGRPESL